MCRDIRSAWSARSPTLQRANKDAEKGRKLVQFLDWMLHAGQKDAPALDYAPLPQEVVTKEDSAAYYNRRW